MPENPYEPPPIPSESPGARRKQRPRSPWGYAIAVVVGALLGGIIFDSPMLWTSKDDLVGMVCGALIMVALYHFLPQYEPRDE